MRFLRRLTGIVGAIVLAGTLNAGAASAAPTPAPATTGGQTSIAQKYASVGGARSTLGEAIGEAICGLRDDGCVRTYERGSIYWTQATGAQVVRGGIGVRFHGLAAEQGPLGYPTRGELCGLRGGGCMQNFQGGMVYWSPATGAHPVWGAFGHRYASLNWEFGRLGYPQRQEICGLRDGGCVQHFQGGLLYWSPRTGAHPVWGGMLVEFERMRWEHSVLRYPTGPEFCGLRDGGCGQHFQGGSIYWSGASGAHAIFGAIHGAYAAQGWENGRLRYPTTAEGPVQGTTITQYFQGGRLVYHTDTHRVDSGRPTEQCQASYYGVGTWTASGERFNPSQLTAAHKTLPFRSYARVTNTANGRSVTVRINDRGPFVAGRCIDLSTAAFQAIGDTRSGVINVRVEPL